jgi:hypothetical protein
MLLACGKRISSALRFDPSPPASNVPIPLIFVPVFALPQSSTFAFQKKKITLTEGLLGMGASCDARHPCQKGEIKKMVAKKKKKGFFVSPSRFVGWGGRFF